MKVTVEEQKPTPPPKKVVIELDETQAGMLCSMACEGVAWDSSGDLGDFAERLYEELKRADVADLWSSELQLAPRWTKR